MGYFNHRINRTQFIKGDYSTLRNYTINSILDYSIYFEPLNLFLYTWRFLNQLQHEEANLRLKRFYRIFELVSIVLLPLSFVCIVPAFMIAAAKYDYYHYFTSKYLDILKHNELVTNRLQQTVVFISFLSNLISCVILALVIRLLHSRTKSVQVGREEINK